ncbi:DUF4302 domain-containing protein [Puteibacter caeruleilacunae]|nr:DUF4302 domain-containing protein [Puteibacter caeruleilacunae]
MNYRRMMRQLYTLIIASLLLGACNSDSFEDAFDKTPNERIQENIDHYSKVLTEAQHGWKMAYYINDEAMGAFHFMMQFNKDNKVISQFELSDNNTTSTYSLRAEDEIALSFDTYTFFSVLADPGVEGGQGFGGEFEFYIHSACADSIVMIGKINRRKAVMYPATDFDWNDRFASIHKNQEFLKIQEQPSMEAGDYAIRKLLFNSGLKDSETVDFTYNANNRRVKVAHKDNSGKIHVFDRSVEFNNSGFKLHKSIEINDMSISEFTYNDDQKHFVANNELCVIDYEINGEALISTTAPLWEHTWKMTENWECSESLKPYIEESIKVLGEDNAGLFLFLHNNALITWSFRYRGISGSGDSWSDFFLRQLYVDELNNMCFLMPDNEDQRYDQNREKSRELYTNPKVREFIEILHDPKGWLFIELEYQNKYRLVSKSNSNHWMILENWDPSKN